jgi:hypothetical protein
MAAVSFERLVLGGRVRGSKDRTRCKADTHNPQMSVTIWVDIRLGAGRLAKPVEQS